MMLPVVDGVDVLHALADLGAYVPVLTVSADRARLGRAATAGADATLQEPLDVERLLAVAGRNCAR